MYYPKQIPYLLDKKFSENLLYKEYKIKELEDFCMCIWQIQAKRNLEETIYNYILPDACIDMVIDFSIKTVCFAGFSKETMSFPLQQKIDYLGIRLKPGTFYYLFGIPAEKIMDRQIPFAKIDASFFIEDMLKKTKTEERINYLKNYWLEKIKEKSIPPYLSMIDELYKNPTNQSLFALENYFHCKERQVQRICKIYYGVSPKVLLNIIRLHICLTLLLDNKTDLLEIANQCGFFDQSHFTKEIKKYTGISPLKLMEKCQ